MGPFRLRTGRHERFQGGVDVETAHPDAGLCIGRTIRRSPNAGSEQEKAPNPHSSRELERIFEGDCVQMLHVGPFSTEPETVRQIFEYIEAQRLTANGRHHEIYLSDPRRTPPHRMKTILRHPVIQRKK
ncbi:GyrI-like domain-containing protein [Paenibacillus rhizosphaerae]|uniref:GyrI-like domain-containing protein n=1 Tax=Paenibacillus rhizosphaerae TaxID=297318 RepID=UPI0028ACB379|nr:GyrI-like domain-containing protein [Paenibacillus rhizosphaerae]